MRDIPVGTIPDTQRIIGNYSKGKPGIHVVFLGGMHGNEPSGVVAIQNVLRTLADGNIDFKGKLTGIRGNIPALNEGKRYVDVDLNRIWNTRFTPEITISTQSQEYNEKKDLIDTFSQILDGESETVFIDLHTTSADGAPFMAIGDTIRNRDLIQGIPTPVILGFEEHMKGTLFNFFNHLGVCSVLFEGGQHESLMAMKNHYAFIWLILVNLGCLNPEDLPFLDEQTQWLKKASEGKSRIYETIFRYSIEKRELFLMDRGYSNFQPVKKGQPIATYDNQRIHPKYSGRIFMPLYQEQGSDGFFIIREVAQFWVNLSRHLRKFGSRKYLHFLPGIRKHSKLEGAFIINARIALIFPRQFFHLFGYKKLFLGNGDLVMIRRNYDLEPPSHKQVRQEFLELARIN